MKTKLCNRCLKRKSLKKFYVYNCKHTLKSGLLKTYRIPRSMCIKCYSVVAALKYVPKPRYRMPEADSKTATKEEKLKSDRRKAFRKWWLKNKDIHRARNYNKNK